MTRVKRWPVALVTGASSGIGLEMAKQLAAEGSKLVLVARSKDVMSDLAHELDVRHGTECEIIAADLRDREQLAVVERRLADEAYPIDLLVNNAGYGLAGKFWEHDADAHDQMLQLNVVALTRLCRAVLPVMRARGSGGILNVSSIGGFVPSYDYACYGASKSYVTAFTEVLHTELKGSGVHATCLAPGFTRTGFQATSGNEAEGLPDFAWQSAADVARAGLDAVAANRTVWVPGLKNQVSVGMLRLVPRAVQRRLSAAVVERF